MGKHCNFPEPDADGSIPGQRIEIECSECKRLREELRLAQIYIDGMNKANDELKAQLGQECPTCQRWKGTKFPIVLAVRDLEITINKKE